MRDIHAPSKRQLVREISAIISTNKKPVYKLAQYIIDKVLEWNSFSRSQNTADGDVLRVIQGFNKHDDCSVLRKTFTLGYCYYFSIILRERFPDGVIVYSPTRGHFFCKIDGKLYDVTGEAEVDIYYDFDNYPDLLQKERIVRDCILKEAS